MLPRQNSLDRIPELEPVNLDVNSETELEELDEKMKYISQQIAEEFHILNNIVSKTNSVLNINYNNNFMNKNFDQQENIEWYLDSLVHEYQNVKKLLKKGREIRYHKEKKEKEKEKYSDIRCKQNTLSNYEIKLGQ